MHNNETFLGLPEMMPIKKIKKETEHHFTVFFEKNIDFKPGQFIMLWLPRIDEKPFTISYHNENEFGITIEAKGRFTNMVQNLSKGDMLGIRGPYGNPFKILSGKKVCVVAGGCGIAPIAPLIDLLFDAKNKVTVIQGAKNKQALLFRERFKEVEYCTDDGSYGTKGFTTTIFEENIKSKKVNGEKFDMVYSCGPEIMMKLIFDICEKYKIPLQVSLERYMRCGFGICGACTCGKERVCVDGPVFDSMKLKVMDDFGKSAQLKSGKEVSLNEYFTWRCT